MKKHFVQLLIAITSLQGFSQNTKRPVDYVNVFTGTSNSRWMISPGALLPFGMVKLAPDNQGNVWNGGYEYTNASISGFSHLHGMTLSGVSYMPITGNLYFGEEYAKLFPGNADGPYNGMWTCGYRSRFKKEDEKGSPGYYSVKLYDYNVNVELTSTTRCGLMRLTYPKGNESHLILDLDCPSEELANIKKTYVEKTSENEISGYINQSNQYAGNYTVYFVSQFSKAFTSIDGWQYEKYTGGDMNYGTDWKRKCKLQKNIHTFEGKEKSGVVLNFSTTEGEKVIVRTGISFVSLENARQNLLTEVKPFDWDFDKVVENASNVWNELLSRVEVKSKTEENVSKFYTNFYRSFCGKNIFNDVNGEYIDMCGKVQNVVSPANYIFSGDGFWGAQWTLFPFWTLIAPDWSNAMSNSFLSLADNGGWIPEAPTALKYAPIMGAQHHNALIISSCLKGIANFDKTKAYAAIKHDYTTPGINHPCGGFAGNRHLQTYMDLGYVPDEIGPVSNTLEYAFDDWCMGEFARAMGNKKDADYFQHRSMNYKNIFDAETGYMRRKHKDGSWFKDFDPFRVGTDGGWNGPGYMEGNAWVYTWYVPQDLPGLINLIGKERFNNRLEEGFNKNYVDLGNEPNLQAPFLFNYSGKPWLTQFYSRYVAEKFFNLSPLSGWAGEEDEGQISSLYCLISMGLFEMKAGCSVEPYYDVSSPVFDEVVIHLDPKYYPGKTFVIKAENNSAENVYIQSMLLNGKALTTPTLLQKEISKGGKLLLKLGSQPNKEYWNKK